MTEIIGIIILNAGFSAIGGWAWLDNRRYEKHVQQALSVLD